MTGINHERVVGHGDKGTHEDWNKDHKQKGNHDCEQHQHLNHVLENRTTYPPGPVPGQIIFRSDFPNAFVWDGTKWVSLTPVATIVVAADGTGNTTDIQEGINLLPAPGGVVYIKEGTYNVTVGITIPNNNISIFGAGHSTIIKGANGIFIISATGKNYLSFRDIYFANIPGQNPSTCIKLDDSIGSFIESCWLDGYTGLGIELVGTTTGTTVRNCNISGGLVGIGMIGNDAVIGFNYIENAVVAGILADNGALRYRFTGNIILGCNRGLWGGEIIDCSFTGNCFQNNTADGMLLQDSNENTITGNNINDNGGDGVEIGANCDRNIIVANQIYNNTGLSIRDNGTNTLAANNIIA